MGESMKLHLYVQPLTGADITTPDHQVLGSHRSTGPLGPLLQMLKSTKQGKSQHPVDMHREGEANFCCVQPLRFGNQCAVTACNFSRLD